MAVLPATPAQKNMFNIMQSGTGFVNPLDAGSSAISGKIAGVAGHVSSLTTAMADPTHGAALTAAGFTTAKLTALTASATKGAEHVTKLTEYGAKATAEFSQRMRVADQYKNTMMRFTGTDVGCSAHTGVMGMVQDAGQKAMDAYHSVMDTMDKAITALNDAIAKGLATVAQLATAAMTAINHAIQAATDFANKVIKGIEDEAAELAKQLSASTHAWLATHLPDWFSDSCKAPITNHVSSPALKTAAGH